MSRKTKRNLGRATQLTDVSEIRRDLTAALAQIRAMVGEADALAHVETFCAIALRVMTKTAPGVIRQAAMVEETLARIDGRPVDSADVNSPAWLEEHAPITPAAWASLCAINEVSQPALVLPPALWDRAKAEGFDLSGIERLERLT
ncbi:MAG: hypothetical protein ACK4MG_14225 [Aquabacterium sp.]